MCYPLNRDLSGSVNTYANKKNALIDAGIANFMGTQ